MPRGVYKRGKRIEYQNETKASRVRKILATMSEEMRTDINNCKEAVKKAGIKVTDSDLYKYRMEFKKGENGQAGPDIFAYVLAVQKCAKACGGIENVKRAIAMIERVKSIS